MSDKYKVESTSSHSATVDDIELSQSTNTRKIIRSIIIDNPKDKDACVKIDILHQKAASKGQFEDIVAERLSSYKARDIGKLSLDSEETKKLFTHLQNLYAIHSKLGTPLGESEIIVGHEEEIIRVDPKRADFIKKLIQQGHSEEVWRQLIDSDPDLATKLSQSRVQQARERSLSKFSEMMQNEDLTEQDWQDFFEDNTWIFGYGLKYQILKTVQSQPHYGSQTVQGKGTNKGDFLQATQASNKFTVLVEIKKPNTLLLEEKQYRNDVHNPSEDLIGGASQLRQNSRTWEMEGSGQRKNRESLEEKSIFTIKPKGILVIGNTSQLKNTIYRENFELFRRGQNDIEIITFDELFERAKFIVEHTE